MLKLIFQANAFQNVSKKAPVISELLVHNSVVLMQQWPNEQYYNNNIQMASPYFCTKLYREGSAINLQKCYFKGQPS